MNARPPQKTRALLFVGVLVASVVITPIQVHAQVPGAPSFSFGAAAGLAVPAGDLSDFTSSGYTVGLTLGMKQALVPFSLRAEGSFTELPFSDNSDAKHRIIGFALDGQYNLSTATPTGGLYLTGGVGTYGWNDVNSLANSDRTWDVGINVGLGYYVQLTGFTVNFEGRFVNVFSNTNQRLFPITVGVTF
ncbi:MAG TPA: hypothetical protein VJO33_00675 [Gemmatimonadaceae bacterium]|nr:hypothetical protein [Gemmatimonadaceae bacterium]